ncbi:hypothetical protein [Nocardia mangyaensis]|uniref:hypothetical protein n=1 Tax=Nocardia mangyaensis TaxID=2213200 RepID=UPI002674637D|nr:hypothetical protein [Nocardia mangyaensis]MDO3646197.1 hypothetical protein [Nocardia mangyaensis]
MNDPHPATADSTPIPLFSAPRHSDATSSTTDPVPGNVLPTFLAASPAADVSGQG